MSNKIKYTLVSLLIGLTWAPGCGKWNSAEKGGLGPSSSGESSSGNTSDRQLTRIKAVGRLEPAGGVIPVIPKPGDRIEKINVSVGETYARGEEVAELAGTKLLNSEVRVAEAQLAEAAAQKEAELDAADAKLAVVDQAIAANRLKLEEARDRLEGARAEGGEFELLAAKVELAKEALEKLEQAAAPGPGGRSIATQSQLRQQELAVKAARHELLSAKREAENAVKVAEMTLAASEKERKAAEAAKLAAASAVPLDSAKEKIELLKEQIEAGKPRMPITGKVLSIQVTVGQPTSTMPIMQVADLSSMVCRAEVPVEDLHLIELGDRVLITGGGLASDISGEVSEISMLVGSPKMTSLNPMDPVDYRMAPVRITIDPDYVESARKLVNTQVKVEIDLNAARLHRSNSRSSSSIQSE